MVKNGVGKGGAAPTEPGHAEADGIGTFGGVLPDGARGGVQSVPMAGNNAAPRFRGPVAASDRISQLAHDPDEIL